MLNVYTLHIRSTMKWQDISLQILYTIPFVLGLCTAINIHSGSGMSVCSSDSNAQLPSHVALESHAQRPLRTNPIHMDHNQQRRRSLDIPHRSGPLLAPPTYARNSIGSPMTVYPLPSGKRECAMCHKYVGAQESRRFAICYLCYHHFAQRKNYNL